MLCDFYFILLTPGGTPDEKVALLEHEVRRAICTTEFKDLCPDPLNWASDRAHRSVMSDEFSPCCNSSHRILRLDPSAAHPMGRYGRRTHAGSSRSGLPRSRFATASPGQSACRGCCPCSKFNWRNRGQRQHRAASPQRHRESVAPHSLWRTTRRISHSRRPLQPSQRPSGWPSDLQAPGLSHAR
jgi:hypothetical protein